MKMNFSTPHLREVFAEEGKYENFRKLAYDLNHGNKIYEYDDEGNQREISKRDANKAIRKVIMEICGLTEEDLKSKKKRKRALEAHAKEVYEVIEEDVDFKVEEGFRESEWFNQFVDSRNLALGDANEFWTTDNIILAIAEIAGDNHDLTLQALNEGESYRVKTSVYAAKVGKDIDLILLGRVDFTELTDKIAEAFVYFVQTTTYEEVYNAADKLPSNPQFSKTGTLDAASKENFDLLIEDVATANNSDVVIMGTKTALKKLNALADVDWLAASQKEAVANTGRLGSYEGTVLVEIPQRFALNDTTTKLIDNNMLLVFPTIEDKFVKFVDVGETEIVERGQQKADLADDFQTYEVQREMGVSVQLGRYFGRWMVE